MLKQSLMMKLGSQAPPFSLPDAAGHVHTLDEFAGSKALVVAFICNHCPYVKHMIAALAQFAREYQSRGLAVVAISSNDVNSHPDDAPPKMAQFARQHGFIFPYLYDESQAVALAYQAVCTPDLFLFDAARRLAYCGQFDGSRPGNKLPVTGANLRAAADAILAGQPAPGQQHPSTGCNIKWKPANEPSWG
jgi:peroxiredoxin